MDKMVETYKKFENNIENIFDDSGIELNHLRKEAVLEFLDFSGLLSFDDFANLLVEERNKYIESIRSSYDSDLKKIF